MANRIYITHSDRVTLREAIEAVHVCLKYGVKPGTFTELTNELAVIYSDKTKHPSFQVGRTRE